MLEENFQVIAFYPLKRIPSRNYTIIMYISNQASCVSIQTTHSNQWIGDNIIIPSLSRLFMSIRRRCGAFEIHNPMARSYLVRYDLFFWRYNSFALWKMYRVMQVVLPDSMYETNLNGTYTIQQYETYYTHSRVKRGKPSNRPPYQLYQESQSNKGKLENSLFCLRRASLVMGQLE